MDDQRINLTKDISEPDFVSTSTAGALTKGENKIDIIDSPYKIENGTCLYTREQVEQMFKNNCNCSNRRKRRPDNVYCRIRKMNVGESLVFPYEDWNAARSAASQLRLFGGKYRVTKGEPIGEPADITVKRIQ